MLYVQSRELINISRFHFLTLLDDYDTTNMTNDIENLFLKIFSPDTQIFKSYLLNEMIN